MARGKQVNISQIIKHADDLGYDSHQYVWMQEIQPMYELNKSPWEYSDFEDDNETYDFPKQTRIIMRSFFDSINRSRIIVVKD